MCGIFGYSGKLQANLEVINGLKNLQYRGYDSCGIAYNSNNKWEIKKALGDLNNLQVDSIFTNLAFGHTRWATTGEVTLNNAHPHISYNNDIIVVHNGIITNAKDIKSKLKKSGISFYSNTDTEVIANYLAFKGDNIESNLPNLYKEFQGSFALIVAHKQNLYLLKNFSPLHVLSNEKGIYISSDVASLPSGNLYSLVDGDIIKICNQNIISLKTKIQYHKHIQPQNTFNLSHHEYYMIKEIMETPEAIKNTYLNLNIKELVEVFKKYSQFTLIGCGTAYNSCLIGEYFLKDLMYKVNSIIASNFKLTTHVNKKHLHIIVSQSGETADCIKAANEIKNNGGSILLITNERYSTLTKLANYVVYTSAKKEVAVASTKTYCCQVFIFSYLYSMLKNPNYRFSLNFIKQLKTYINSIDIKDLATKLSQIDKLILVGKDIDYITLVEASLKIREINYIFTLPMYAGELKHGTLALIDENSYVLVLNSIKCTNLDTTINEIKSRKGNVIMFNGPFHLNIDPQFIPIFSIIPFQLLSYYTAICKNINPDMPRNLAKSVTVE